MRAFPQTLDRPAESELGTQEANPVIDTPQIVQTDRRITAVIRFTSPRAEIQKVMGPGIAEVMAAVADQGLTPAGPIFSYHLKMDPETFDFEVGVPVPKPVSAVGRVKASQLPAAKVARTVYHGPYEGLTSAWGEFDAWIVAAGHTRAPDLWEYYVAGPESSPDPATWRTELNRPLIR
jgi:effector-binding domain-containing protein